MAAGERARRRAEREQVVAAETAAREAEQARRTRREARTSRLTGWLPRTAPGPTGVLAARRRQQSGLVVAAVVAVNLLTWLGTDSWPPRVLVLLLTVLLTPIAVSLLNRK